MCDDTRWGWIKPSSKKKSESGWLSNKEFQLRFPTSWEEKWKQAPTDEMPTQSEFCKFYGQSWKQHWDWHHDDTDDEAAQKEEQKDCERKHTGTVLASAPKW